MIKQYQSPLEKAIKQQQYSKHLQRIDHILRRHKTADYFQTPTDQRPRHSFNHQTQKQIAEINAFNAKHNKKLDEIKWKKSSSVNKMSDKGEGSPNDSPYKKRERKRIEEENLKIIDKIITMKCADSAGKVKKNVDEYKRMRDRLKQNKSVSVKLPSYKTMEVRSKMGRNTPMFQ